MELHPKQALQASCPQYGRAWNTRLRNSAVAASAASLTQWSNIHVDPRDIGLGDQRDTMEWTVTAILAEPLHAADITAHPQEQPVQFDAVDILVWNVGRIARKDTSIDAITLQDQRLARANR